MSPLRVSRAERFAGWLIFGPIGHLAAGLLFFAELLARYWWARALKRPIGDAWDREPEKA